MNTLNIHEINFGSRLARFVLGMGLIMSILFAGTPVGWATLIPLIGIYPTLTAFLGCDPLLGAIETAACKVGISSACPIRHNLARA